MRYKDLRDAAHERSGLLDKKRPGKRHKARLAELDGMLAAVPPPTPPRNVTGERGDFQGNTFALRSGKRAGRRSMVRQLKFGHYGDQPMRSRIQRARRKRRTGGVR